MIDPYTHSMQHQEEKRKKVRLMGTDLYMAIMQALDMTLASGQAKKVEEADEAKEAQKAQESVIASGTADAQETDRQRRARQRSTLKRKRDEADKVKKAKKKKEDENKAGPSGNSRNDQIKREKQRQIAKAEALTKMIELTGLTRKECAQALAIQKEAEPDRDFIEIYWSACHMLLEDGDPSKEGYANLVKGFQG